MQRIVAVHSNTYHGFPLDDAIDGIRAAGFRHIELTATRGWTEHVDPSMRFDALIRVQDRIRAAGLTPIALSGHANLMDRERIGDFLENIRLANFFHCARIVSSVGEAHLQDRAVVTNAQVAEHARGLVPALEENGLALVLENHGEHATGAIIREIVEAVGSPRLRINFDTANGIYYAGADPVEDLRGCVDLVGYMHLKDKIGGKGEWNFPAPGQGQVDFPAIFDTLERAGNDCPISIEIEFTSAGPKDLEEVNRAVRSAYEYLRGLGMEI